MSDMINDPYAGVDSEEERQVIYQRLQKQYMEEHTVWENEQKEVERRKTIYDDHMKTWYYQRDIQKDLDERSHRNILTIAAGSFGVSFAFISQIVEMDNAVNKIVLVSAWALFGLAIILALFELKIGSVIQDVLLGEIERNIIRAWDGKSCQNRHRWIVMGFVRVISWFMFASFVAGVICLLYFVLTNITPR